MKKKLTALLLIILAIPLLLFVVVDYRVSRRIAERATTPVPAILSAPFRVRSGQLVRPTTFRDELLRRRYSESKVTPVSPGEFRIYGDSLQVYVHSFVNAHRQTVPASLYHYHFLNGDIIRDSAAARTLELGPHPISHLGGGNVEARQYKGLAQIPQSLQDAVLAIEDERFFSHFGIDLISIARALVSNISAGRVVQGGSTITQQLAKNLLFSPRRTLQRKLLEAFAALSLELRLTKKKILELYLNEVYLGQEGSVAIHGVESAAYYLFGKSVERISVDEAATLAGLIQAPSLYAPRRFPRRATKRRNVVLSKMTELGFLPQAHTDALSAHPVKTVQSRRFSQIAPHFTTYIRQQLAKSLDVNAATLSGASVYTGLSIGMQRCADEAVARGLKDLKAKKPTLATADPPLEAGLVAIEPFSGLIKAWSGSSNYSRNQFDHVSQSQRQIGSTIKPFLYLTALDGSLNRYKVATSRSVLSDRPLTVDLVTGDSWTPANFDKKFRGNVTLRYALERSLNLPAVYVGQRVGVSALVNTVKLYHINQSPPAVPALALGAIDTSLLKLTAAYAALANGGIYIKPREFISALTGAGELLSTNTILEEPVSSRAAVYVLSDILQGVIERGTGAVVRRLGFKRPAAGKTGTSNDTRDAWFLGYTPTLATGVWVGFDDNRKFGLTGGSAAAPIWTEFMKCAEPFYNDEAFIAPPDVVSTAIDAATGRIWTDDCPGQRVSEVFVRGTEPTRACTGSYRVQKRSKTPDRYTPGKQPERRSPRRKRSFWDLLFSGE